MHNRAISSHKILCNVLSYKNVNHILCRRRQLYKPIIYNNAGGDQSYNWLSAVRIFGHVLSQFA